MSSSTIKNEQLKQSADLIRSSLKLCHRAEPAPGLPPELEALMTKLREKEMRQDAQAQARAGAAGQSMAAGRGTR